MKILLITLPRTGSTSLLKKISEEENLIPISEPFNDINGNFKKYKNYNWENEDNICVKKHINHKDIPFYLDFMKFFNKVILLSRKDLNACAESLSYANHFQNFTEKYEWTNTPNLKHNIKLINEYNEKLEKLSKLIDINISYYENLFDINSENKLRQHDVKRKNII
jgi:hypothetical protein